jgi:hypothetical protein
MSTSTLTSKGQPTTSRILKQFALFISPSSGIAEGLPLLGESHT